MKKTIGDYIKQYRGESDKTLEDLAIDMSKSRSWVSELERGKNKSVKKADLLKLKEVLNIPENIVEEMRTVMELSKLSDSTRQRLEIIENESEKYKELLEIFRTVKESHEFVRSAVLEKMLNEYTK